MTYVRARTIPKELQFFCRHLVGLCVTYRYKDAPAGEADHFDAYSGTLIEIDQGVYFLTAGHILRNLETAQLRFGTESS